MSVCRQLELLNRLQQNTDPWEQAHPNPSQQGQARMACARQVNALSLACLLAITALAGMRAKRICDDGRSC